VQAPTKIGLYGMGWAFPGVKKLMDDGLAQPGEAGLGLRIADPEVWLEAMQGVRASAAAR
jgi:hypothetical protein